MALARPAPGRVAAWGAGVGAAVARMQDIWAGHIEVTEGAQGLYEEILGQAPRLSNQVQRLRREHEQIGVAIRDANDSLSAIDDDRLSTVREELTELVAQLLRHRQRGADLVYEAYHVDIGGGE
jgi:chromosome segregation ATPase